MLLAQREREEMCSMSKASEISRNVWLGPTPSPSPGRTSGKEGEPSFDIFIETNDLAQPLCLRALNRIGELSYSTPQHLEFPSSGSVMPPITSMANVDPLTEMCSWIYQLANPSITPDTSEDEGDEDGDIPMKKMFSNARKVLIHCTDGYTESTLLGLAYFMYAEAVPMHEAWLRLHCEKNRNFFAYPSDVTLLASLQPWLLRASKRPMARNSIAFRNEPPWLSRMDGSLPSRILPYMYLGNLGHANNPSLLNAMGIKKILSIGEPLAWSKVEVEKWGAKNMLFIARVQDNGVDPLMNQFDQCLQFISTEPFAFLLLNGKRDLTWECRKRYSGWNSNSSPLPGWGLAVGNHLHCGSDGFPWHLFSPGVVSYLLIKAWFLSLVLFQFFAIFLNNSRFQLLRPSTPSECHYSASSSLRLRASQMGRVTATETRRAYPPGA